MTITQKIELQCDLCKHPAKQFKTEHDAVAAGWITCNHECYMEDRSFYASHICPTCAKQIEEYLRKKRRKEQETAFAKATSEQFAQPAGESGSSVFQAKYEDSEKLEWTS